MTEYQRTIEWLYTLEAAKGMDFKLERVALALQRLGDPQQRFASLHLAGTNGKGSVAAMLHAVLATAGYRTGLYTSPHLVSFCERFQINGNPIAEADVVRLVAAIEPVRQAVAADPQFREPTFFETITAIALQYFH